MIATRVLASPEDLAKAAAKLLLDRIEAAWHRRGRAIVVLAGGATPVPCYRELVGLGRKAAIPADAVTWLLGDERWVAVTHPDSNEGMARRELLGPLGVAQQCIVSWHAGSDTPIGRARAYAEAVGTVGPPDLVVLGIGSDGHTASLFPGATAHLPDGKKLPVQPGLPARAAAVLLADQATWRLTLCPVYLTTSRSVVFLAAGASKRAALARALAGDPATPAAWIRGAETVCLADREAMMEAEDDGAFRHA